ncbi:hypothetical protein LJC19_07010 [Oxalobacter sp. OttesenSCG-928-P03]|nr:hypothetical protein [Oxalobacter sp. OttesenSCG-928-P03]
MRRRLALIGVKVKNIEYGDENRARYDMTWKPSKEDVSDLPDQWLYCIEGHLRSSRASWVRIKKSEDGGMNWSAKGVDRVYGGGPALLAAVTFLISAYIDEMTDKGE